MLSFLNTIPTAGNGKTGPTGNAVQSAATRDTSGEGTKTFCNGNAGGKRKKKGKQPASAAKMPKLTAAATVTTTTTLEPIGIIIPKPLDKPADEDEKDVEIPRIDSPLFKDIPSKRAGSSSDLSSPGGNTSSSDDSSSSDDDSVDEEAKNKDTNTSNISQEEDPTEESSKLRTPIKLTISNLGKPSATVVSTAALDFIASNSSDSEKDIGVKDAEKKTKFQSHPLLQEKAIGSLDNPHAITNSVQSDAAQTELLKNSMDNNTGHIDSGQLQNNSKLTHIDKGVGGVKELCNDVDLHNNIGFSLRKSDKSDANFLAINSLSAEKNNSCKDKPVNANFRANSSKNCVGELKIEEVENEVRITIGKQGEFVNKDTELADEPQPSSEEQLLNDDNKIESNLDSVLLQDSCETKYCPGSLLSPTLSKPLQHLKANLSQPQNDLDSIGTKNSKNSCSLVTGITPRNDTVADKLELLDNDCEQSTLVIKNNFLQGCELYTPTENTFLLKDAIQDEMTEKIKADKLSSTEKSHIQNVEDQNLSVNTSESKDENSEKSLGAPKTYENTCETILTKMSVNIARKTGPKCKDTPISSHSLIKNTATKMTASLTTTTTNSGSIMSPTSENSAKTSGFTNGIPDSENPFITWKKYDDDDDDSVNTSLPASSLVHNLARVPFPLALAGESSIPHISPIHVAVSQLSPLALAGQSPGGGQLPISPGNQMPLLSSPNSRRLRSSPSHSHAKQQLSLPHIQLIHGCDESKASQDEDNKARPAHKSGKRTSRLSNIIDSLRTSKEKQAAGSNQIFEDQSKKGTLDAGSGRKSLSPELSSVTSQKSSSSSPVFSMPLGSDHRLSNENIFCDSLGFPHQFSTNADHVIRSSLDAARAQTIDKSFNALKDDLDKGKRMLESLETMRNGTLDPYSKSSDSRTLKQDSSSSQNRSKSSSSVFSSSTALSMAPSRPSSRQSAKPSIQTYPSPSLPSSRTNTITTTSSNSLSSGSGISINNSMYHVAPSTALAAAHMELNAAAANILTFQHMYGMQDPYMMKTLMSNPLYLQRMMEYQKQAMDPVMLRQIEMFEAAAAAENTKNSKEQQAAMNAQSILWQAHAASILQHQQMQQIQQLQLHHQQQQLQQQVAAARERETRETIAAIMTSKSNLITPSNKSSGSIYTGPSAKPLTASASTTLSMSSSTQSSSKRPRTAVTPSSMDIYSRDAPSLEKKLRASHQNSSHISNHNFNSSTPALNSASLSLFRHAHLSNKPSSNNSNNTKPHTGSSTSSHQSKHEYLNFPTALQLSSAASPHLWGFPALLQPASLEMAHMAQFYEQANDAQSLSLAVGPAESEATGTEVLDLSVKPKT